MYNPKPDHKVLAPSKLKAYLQTTISKLLQWCNLIGQHFFLSSCFLQPPVSRLLKLGIVWHRVVLPGLTGFQMTN